jgi:cytochrome c oxidase subunit 2
MRAKVIALTPEDFQTWLNTAESAALADVGPRLLQNKGCIGCHSLDGSAKIGPTFKRLVGRREIVVMGGQEKEITVDEAFIRAHILDPRAAAVKGYPPVMPQVPMTDDELKTIVAYLESVK